MSADMQSELAIDQFIHAITPRELRVQSQLAQPHTLQEALKLARLLELLQRLTILELALL